MNRRNEYKYAYFLFKKNISNLCLKKFMSLSQPRRGPCFLNCIRKSYKEMQFINICFRRGEFDVPTQGCVSGMLLFSVLLCLTKPTSKEKLITIKIL
jgi:hypothetical protein